MSRSIKIFYTVKSKSDLKHSKIILKILTYFIYNLHKIAQFTFGLDKLNKQ